MNAIGQRRKPPNRRRVSFGQFGARAKREAAARGALGQGH
jgi:hypothetical protein